MFTVSVAGTVSVVDKLVINLNRIQWNQSKPVCEEFIGKNGRIGFDFDKIDCWEKVSP